MHLVENDLVDTKITILKKKTCPSLSGKSTLTYLVGCTSTGDILIKIEKNSGPGKYNNQWIFSDTILNMIRQSDKPFTWSILMPIFKGQSVNSSGFLMAALKTEGVVKAVEAGYALHDADALKRKLKKQKKPTKRRAAC